MQKHIFRILAIILSVIIVLQNTGLTVKADTSETTENSNDGNEIYQEMASPSDSEANDVLEVLPQDETEDDSEDENEILDNFEQEDFAPAQDVYVDDDGKVWFSDFYIGTADKKSFDFKQVGKNKIQLSFDFNADNCNYWYSMSKSLDKDASFSAEIEEPKGSQLVFNITKYYDHKGILYLDTSGMQNDKPYNLNLQINIGCAFFKCISHNGNVYFASSTKYTRGDLDGYEKINNLLYKSFYNNNLERYLEKQAFKESTIEVEKFTKNIIKKCSNEYEKFRTIYEWLINNIAYGEIHMGIKKPDATLKDREGICGDISLLFQAMLLYANIPCQFVDLGSHALNMVCLSGTWYCVDATNGFICDSVGSQGSPFSFEYATIVNYYETYSISYTTHVQTYEWQSWRDDGELAGTVGEAKRLEAIRINIFNGVNDVDNGKVLYRTHVQSYGWQGWKEDGEISGTEGEAKRLEAIQIKLSGYISQYYDVYYRVQAQTYGWLDWAKNGESAGTAGLAKRLEAIQIVLVGKGLPLDNAKLDELANITSSTKRTTGTAYVTKAPDILYRTHVQSFGWQNFVSNGAMSGTSGQAKRLEAIEIKLNSTPYEGGIRYKTHVQTYGWQGWKQNGTMSGTSGQAKRLEAVAIELTGEMAKHYDVYYRVHAQSYGWLGWAKNGQNAGTAGYAKRLEGIQIVLVEKGKPAPSTTYKGITADRKETYISK